MLHQQRPTLEPYHQTFGASMTVSLFSLFLTHSVHPERAFDIALFCQVSHLCHPSQKQSCSWQTELEKHGIYPLVPFSSSHIWVVLLWHLERVVLCHPLNLFKQSAPNKYGTGSVIYVVGIKPPPRQTYLLTSIKKNKQKQRNQKTPI